MVVTINTLYTTIVPYTISSASSMYSEDCIHIRKLTTTIKSRSWSNLSWSIVTLKYFIKNLPLIDRVIIMLDGAFTGKWYLTIEGTSCALHKGDHSMQPTLLRWLKMIKVSWVKWLKLTTVRTRNAGKKSGRKEVAGNNKTEFDFAESQTAMVYISH